MEQLIGEVTYSKSPIYRIFSIKEDAKVRLILEEVIIKVSL